jgi:malonyl-CoA/methylmalonyl-CoA synthetase
MANPLYDTLFGRHQGKTTPFIQLADGQVITHGAFVELAAQYAHLFEKIGLEPGDRVAVQIEKSPQSLAVYAACVQAGMVFLPLNIAYTAEELSYFAHDSGARLVLCDHKRLDALKPIAIAAGARLETMNADGQGSFSRQAASMPTTFATVVRSTEDLAAFLYTSGTTGRSKGAMLTQENLLSNGQVLTKEWAFTASDVLLHALPIYHTHGLFVATNIALLSGCKILFLPKFDLEAIIELLPQATALMGVPTFYTRLLDDPGFTKDLTQHMRLFVSGSAPLLSETHLRFEERTGHQILERYGMTETNMNTSNPYDGERRGGTVGFRNMPEKTAKELREDGFFITGDLGQIDADGYVQIVGRNKDLIISGGYNIYPKEIELLLDMQDGVLESAIVGVPHPDFGETVVGILVANPGETPDLEAINKNITTSLARFKHPQKLFLLPELPRNTMGKVQKKTLREEFGDMFLSK